MKLLGIEACQSTLLLMVAALLVGMPGSGHAWEKDRPLRIGVLSFAPTSDSPAWKRWLEPLRQGLAEKGWVDGKTVTFQYRHANSDPSKISSAAREIVALNPDVVFAIATPMVRAMHNATSTIPIVAADFTADPVAEGYAESYARPGGNITGVFLDAPEFAGKWFDLLNSMVPNLSRVTVLWDTSPGATHLQAVQAVAQSLRIELQILEVKQPDDIDIAFQRIDDQAQAIIILPSPMVYDESPRLARLAFKYRLPATSMDRNFAIAGGTISYGPDLASAWESVAALVAKILDGRDPAVLPVERPTKFQLVVNMKSASKLGLNIPQSILLRTDEVIR